MVDGDQNVIVSGDDGPGPGQSDRALELAAAIKRVPPDRIRGAFPPDPDGTILPDRETGHRRTVRRESLRGSESTLDHMADSTGVGAAELPTHETNNDASHQEKYHTSHRYSAKR
jgi:hypothetical protein